MQIGRLTFGIEMRWPLHKPHHGSTTTGFLFGLLSLLMLAACGATSQQRLLYQASDIEVGLITDGSTNEYAEPPVRNRHPVDLTPQNIRALLGSLEVSGWSGALIGLFSPPQPRPVFTWSELAQLAEPLAAAFRIATPGERIFFSIQNPAEPYESDRTSGSLFFRDDYLHVVLTDHVAFLQADSGGGETRDPRDTKGMKLWVVAPAQATTVPEEKEPRWNAFEKVHISLRPTEVLAGQRMSHAENSSSPSRFTAGQPASKDYSPATHTTESVNDLRLRIRELTNANVTLRSQLKEQSDTIEKLQHDFEEFVSTNIPGPSKHPSAGPPSRNADPTLTR
jgi:hypothetical protein